MVRRNTRKTVVGIFFTAILLAAMAAYVLGGDINLGVTSPSANYSVLNGTTYPITITFGADATAGANVSIKYFNGSDWFVLNETDNASSPFTHPFNTLNGSFGDVYRVGTLNITVWNNSDLGDRNETILNVTIDNTYPNASIDTMTAPFSGSSVAITGVYNDTNPKNYTVYAAPATGGAWTEICSNSSVLTNGLNGTLCTWDTTLLTDGTYYIFMHAYDLTGRYNDTNTSSSQSGMVDNTPPNVLFTAPLNGFNLSTSYNFTVNISVGAGSSFGLVNISNGTAGSNSPITLAQGGEGDSQSKIYFALIDTSVLMQGSQVFFVNATDAAGNVNDTESVTVTVDRSNPDANITTVASTVSGVVLVLGWANDSYSFDNYTFEVNTTAGVVFSNTSTAPVSSGGTLSPWDTTALADGVYNVTLTVYDNVGYVNRTWQEGITVDNTPPKLYDVVNPTGRFRGDVVVNVSVIDGIAGFNTTHSVKIHNGTDWADMTLHDGDYVAGNWSATIRTAGLADGVYNFTVNATDNTSNSNASYYITFTVDNTGPFVELLGPADGAYNNTNVFITLVNSTDNYAAKSYCNVTAYNGSIMTMNFTTAVANAATPILLTAGPGNWTWNATCYDNASVQFVGATPTGGNSNTSESNNYIIDIFNVTIPADGVTLGEPDVFVSGYAPNNNVTIWINATDIGYAGIKYVEVDFTGFADGNYSNATYDPAAGLWYIRYQPPNMQAADFNATNITIWAEDNAGNELITWLGDDPYTTVVQYNESVPSGDDSGCINFGSATTNLNLETDFNRVNFVNEIQLYGNETCAALFAGINMALPWGDSYKTVLMLNFTSVNLSSSSSAALFDDMADAIDVTLTLPGDYGDTRIFVNSTYFSALDTNATLTFYDLPYDTVPMMIADDILEQGNLSINSWVSAYSENYSLWAQAQGMVMNVSSGNLTFWVVGFSGYNATDNTDPNVTITAPVEGANSSISTTVITANVNGTGTLVSTAVFTLNGTEVARYNATTNTANCTQSAPGSELMNCQFALDGTAEDGTHIMVVTAYDYGDEAPGNNASANVTFVIDTTAPTVAISTPSADAYVKPVYNVTGTMNDTTSGVEYVQISVNGSVDGNATLNTTLGTWYYEVSGSDSHLHKITADAYDYAGQTAQANLTGLTLDGITPFLYNISNGTESYASTTISWNTTEVANTSVSYGTTLNLTTTSAAATYVTYHPVALSGLTASTLYYFNVTSCDQAGNCNTSGPYNFTTTAAPVTPTSSGGGGGGGVLTSQDALTGTPQIATLSKYGTYYFQLGSSNFMHRIWVKTMHSDGVTFTVESDPVDVYVGLGETEEVDVDGDGDSDIVLTLKSMSDTIITFMISSTGGDEVTVDQEVTEDMTGDAETTPAETASEHTPAETTPAETTPAETTPTETAPEPEPTPVVTDDAVTEAGSKWWLWTSVVIVVIIVVLLLMGRKKGGSTATSNTNDGPKTIPSHLTDHYQPPKHE